MDPWIADANTAGQQFSTQKAEHLLGVTVLSPRRAGAWIATARVLHLVIVVVVAVILAVRENQHNIGIPITWMAYISAKMGRKLSCSQS